MPTAADLLVHPEVVGTIARILRAARIPAQDLKDAIADVQMRILKYLQFRPIWPTTVESMKALAIRCTKSYIIDRHRETKRRREAGHMGTVVENPDDHAQVARRLSERHALDHEKLLNVITEVLDKSDKRALDLRIIEGFADDEDQAEMAAAEGLSHREVRDRVATIRKRIGQAVAAALGAGALVAFLVMRPPGDPRYYPVASDVPADATPLQLAQDLRELAKPYCQKRDWNMCLARLDAARELDPVGDKAPEIQAVRDAAEREQNDLMVPGRAKQ